MKWFVKGERINSIKNASMIVADKPPQNETTEAVPCPTCHCCHRERMGGGKTRCRHCGRGFQAPRVQGCSKGDACPVACGGQLIVRTSTTTGDLQTQFLKCNRCGADGGKAFVPADKVIRRDR